MTDFAMILAADLPAAGDVLAMAKKVSPYIDGIKIGVATLLESGIDTVKRVKDLIGDKPILLDLKIADIGFNDKGKWRGTNAKIIDRIADSGATHVTVHGFPGAESIREAVSIAGERGIGVLLLPTMSHRGAELFFSASIDCSKLRVEVSDEDSDKTPAGVECSDVMEGILLLGEAIGAAGYIGPASRPEDLRKYRAFTKKQIWTPGFGRQDKLGRSLDRQFREWAEILGPRSCAIVGSAIFNASDPERAAAEIARSRDLAITP